ncbi:MAG: protoporphyrinogen oxidase [Firmicutes bacterium]|nr:protoporphyrinogen oxidase [Bacillota bacterium]
MSERIVVVGGGITGLSTAYYLQKKAQAAGREVELVLVERDHQLGGKVQTDHAMGLIIEGGPDSFLARKAWLTDLCKDLGLPLVGTRPGLNRTYIWHDGRLVPLPLGMQIMIPTKLVPFLLTPLISWKGKLRAGLDLLQRPRQGAGDQSMGSFVRRHFGTEVLDRVAAPMLGGIYAGDPYEMSLEATFPMFLSMERKYGSLLLGARKSAPPKGPTGSAFITVATGLRSIIDALIKAMPDVHYRMGREVTALSCGASGQGFTVTLNDGTRLDADTVVLATPGFVSARLLAPVAPDVSQELGQITYNSAVVVSFGFRVQDVPRPLDGSGFLVPKGEPVDITASTWVTTKWPHTGQGDLALIRGYLGRAGDRDWCTASDDEILAAVRRDLKTTMGITAAPVLHRIYRWPDSLPQYKVDHLRRADRMAQQIEKVPGLYVAGAAFRGAGLPDCVREAGEAAAKAAEHLGWE